MPLYALLPTASIIEYLYTSRRRWGPQCLGSEVQPGDKQVHSRQPGDGHDNEYAGENDDKDDDDDDDEETTRCWSHLSWWSAQEWGDFIKEKLFSSGISHDWLESSCDDSNGGHDVDAVEDDLDLPPRRWMPEQSRGSSWVHSWEIAINCNQLQPSTSIYHHHHHHPYPQIIIIIIKHIRPASSF